MWYCLELLDYLGTQPSANKRYVKDMIEAYVMMCAYFEKETAAEAIASLGEDDVEFYIVSLLRNYKARGQDYPEDRRSSATCAKRPKDFFPDWTKVLPDGSNLTDLYPPRSDAIIRPIIAKLFKGNIICPAYRPPYMRNGVAGQAIGKAEPGKPDDLFIDYTWMTEMTERQQKRQWGVLDDPDLLEKAGAYDKAHPGARFSVLRVWSAPHFWPLMLGFDNRENTSFVDCHGRAWDFKFVPKDMPCSEASIHIALFKAMAPFKKQLRTDRQVLLKRDLVLVMAPDEEELLRLSVCATFALQTMPWLREVDLWKSFVNVDLDFLNELDKRFLE